MSKKISAMTAATICNSADVFPIVQGGANLKCTRDVLLAADGGDPLILSQSSGSGITLDQFGNANMSVGIGGQLTLVWNATQVFDAGVTGDVFLNAVPGQGWQVLANGSGINITAGGFVLIYAVAGQDVSVQFNAAVSGNWATAVPTDMQTAINRIAAAVAGLLGTGIP